MHEGYLVIFLALCLGAPPPTEATQTVAFSLLCQRTIETLGPKCLISG